MTDRERCEYCGEQFECVPCATGYELKELKKHIVYQDGLIKTLSAQLERLEGGASGRGEA